MADAQIDNLPGVADQANHQGVSLG